MSLDMAVAEQGYAQCYKILREHGKTFHVMAKLLGTDRGKAIAAIYGFARTADDVVDEAIPNTNKQIIFEELQSMLKKLKQAVESGVGTPVYAVLGETIRKYEIEIYPFEDLVKGVAMDLEKNRYESFDELELYCYRVAGTIGLMITPVAGFKTQSNALEYSKILGTAFQLTNILRDVGEDARRGRIYLPKTELERFRISEEEILSGKLTSNFEALMEFQIDRANLLYKEGLSLIPLVTSFGGKLAFQFAADAYSAILMKIRENHYDVFTKRAHLSFWDKIVLIPRCIWRVLKRSYENN